MPAPFKMLRHLLTARQIDAFADDELAEAQALAVMHHLDECVDCVTELDRAMWAKSVLAQYRHAPVPEDQAAVDRLRTWAEAQVFESG